MDIVLILDIYNRIIDIGNDISETLNISYDELINKNIEDIVPTYLNFSLIENSMSIITQLILNNKKINIKMKKKTGKNNFFLFIEKLNYIHIDFLNNFSTDIIKPLNTIINTISSMNDNDHHITILKNANFTLLEIINNIIDYTKLEIGKIKLSNDLFYLYECIDSSINIVKKKATFKQIDMLYHIDSDLPDFIIGDFQRLRQILILLYTKIITYSKSNTKIYTDLILENIIEKKVNIKISIKYLSEDGYKNLESDFINNYSNIEMYICQELCILMGGKISINSDHTSSIFFNIIMTQIYEEYKVDNLDLDILHDKKVLLLDNNRLNIFELCNQLMKWNMQPYPCYTIDSATFFFNNNIFDLIIVDTSLDLSHIFIENIRKKYPDIPIVGIINKGDSLKQESLYIYRYFIKYPLHENRLSSLLYNIFINIKEDTKIHTINYIKEDINILIYENSKFIQNKLKKILNKLGYFNITIESKLKYFDNYDMCFIDISKQIIDIISTIKNSYIIGITSDVINENNLLNYGFNKILYNPIHLCSVKKIIDSYFIFKDLNN